MINVGELITDPDFTQPNGVTYIRRKCVIVDYEPQVEETTYTVSGIITIAKDSTIKMAPNGDINENEIHVFTHGLLYTTGRIDDQAVNGYLSDVIIWNGKKYKVMSVRDNVQYGYCKSTAVIMEQGVT